MLLAGERSDEIGIWVHLGGIWGGWEAGATAGQRGWAPSHHGPHFARLTTQHLDAAIRAKDPFSDRLLAWDGCSLQPSHYPKRPICVTPSVRFVPFVRCLFCVVFLFSFVLHTLYSSLLDIFSTTHPFLAISFGAAYHGSKLGTRTPPPSSKAILATTTPLVHSFCPRESRGDSRHLVDLPPPLLQPRSSLRHGTARSASAGFPTFQPASKRKSWSESAARSPRPEHLICRERWWCQRGGARPHLQRQRLGFAATSTVLASLNGDGNRHERGISDFLTTLPPSTQDTQNAVLHTTAGSLPLGCGRNTDHPALHVRPHTTCPCQSLPKR